MSTLYCIGTETLMYYLTPPGISLGMSGNLGLALFPLIWHLCSFEPPPPWSSRKRGGLGWPFELWARCPRRRAAERCSGGARSGINSIEEWNQWTTSTD